MSIHKDKKRNTWYVKYQNKTKRGFLTKAVAKQYEAILEIKKNDAPSFLKFNYVAQDFLELKKTRVSKSTYQKLKRAINHNLIPFFNEKYMNNISTLNIRDFLEQLNLTEYSTIHKNFIISVLKNVFEHAKIYFQLENNPTYIALPFKKTHEELLKIQNQQYNIWTLEEFKAFLKAVETDIYKILFRVLFGTGMRIGEVVALTWNDVDFINATLNVNKAYSHDARKVGKTKTLSSIRKIKTSEKLIKDIKKYKKEEQKYYGFKNNWYIFGRTKPISLTSITRNKNKACEKSGVKKIRIHDFRHSHASILISEKKDITAISKRLGHSNIVMTSRVYAHMMKKSEDELNNYIDDLDI